MTSVPCPRTSRKCWSAWRSYAPASRRASPTWTREKLKQLEELLGYRAVQLSPPTRTLRIPTPLAHLDILFDGISGNLRFEGLRSRCVEVSLGELKARVARLEDVIASKQAAGRPKDLAQLPILRDALSVRRALEESEEEA